jgi:hypothetical protein
LCTAYRDPKTALRALTEIAVSQGGYFTAGWSRSTEKAR